MEKAIRVLKVVDGRYEAIVVVGTIVYSGEGNQEYLERWCKRTAVNFGSKSLGVFSEDRIKEAVSCM